MKAWITVDLIAGLGAGAVALTGTYLPGVASVVDPMIAGGFMLLALGRWYTSNRKPAN